MENIKSNVAKISKLRFVLNNEDTISIENKIDFCEHMISKMEHIGTEILVDKYSSDFLGKVEFIEKLKELQKIVGEGEKT